jgi:hypothetical protein
LVLAGVVASLLGHRIQVRTDRRERLLTAYADLLHALHECQNGRGNWREVEAKVLAAELREPDEATRAAFTTSWRSPALSGVDSRQIDEHIDQARAVLKDVVRDRYLRDDLRGLTSSEVGGAGTCADRGSGENLASVRGGSV